VIDYTFVSANSNRIFGTLVNNYYTRITNVSSFGHSKVNLYAVNANYLDVADTKYYVPNTVQEGVPHDVLSDGQVDAVSLLYSDAGIDDFTSDTGNKDPYEILVSNNN
jgi:hypothetical protein